MRLSKYATEMRNTEYPAYTGNAHGLSDISTFAGVGLLHSCATMINAQITAKTTEKRNTSTVRGHRPKGRLDHAPVRCNGPSPLVSFMHRSFRLWCGWCVKRPRSERGVHELSHSRRSRHIAPNAEVSASGAPILFRRNVRRVCPERTPVGSHGLTWCAICN